MKKKIKIILVDDNSIFLEGIKTFLGKKSDYEIVACFQSGIQLLEEIGSHQPDLILLDIEMPGLSGIETAQKLNYMNANIKLIAITLYQENVYLRQLIEAGFRGFVSKNNISEKLFPVIEGVLDNKIVFPEIKLI